MPGGAFVRRRWSALTSRAAVIGTGLAAVALIAPTLAHADPDQDFAAQLHTYGIYGQRDYNAWLGKIMCKRLYNGVDTDAYQSAKFVGRNLPLNSTTEQAWQFVGAAINIYCPDQMPVLLRAAGQPS
jgi:hypothetical protein